VNLGSFAADILSSEQLVFALYVNTLANVFKGSFTQFGKIHWSSTFLSLLLEKSYSMNFDVETGGTQQTVFASLQLYYSKGLWPMQRYPEIEYIGHVLDVS